MFRSTRRPAACAVTAALTLLALLPAPSRALNWNNAAGGSADAAANWLPARVPTATDDMLFGLTGAYTVTFPSPLDSVLNHLFFAGTVTLDCAAPHYGTNLFRVGSGATSNATTVLANGNFRMGRDARIGDVAGSTGLLQVVGAAASLTQNTAGPAFVVGNSGTGTLQVTSGGRVTPANDLIIGQNPGAVGTVTVSGETTTPAYARSQLTEGTHAQPLYTRIGYAGGTGTLEVLNGALYTNNGSLLVGRSPGDVGTMHTGGVALTDSARLIVGGDLVIASGIGLGQPGGTATVFVDSNAVDSVGFTTSIGSPGGGSGVLRIHDKGRLITRSLVWERAGGDLDFPGGTLQINGGTFSTSDQHFKLNSLVNKPVLELLNGATADFFGSGSDTALVIGAKGSGRMRVLGGSALTAHFTNALLGQEAGSVGELIVRDASSVDADALHVGLDGRGEYRLFAGSTGTHSGLIVGEGSGTGIVEVRGAGSAITVDHMYVPFYLSTGSGDVTIGTGGRIDLVAAYSVHSNLGAGGTVHVENGGSLTYNLSLALAGGLFDLQGGNVSSAAAIEITGGGAISGEGDVNAPVTSLNDTTGTITATGPLLLGQSGTPGQGFRFKGELNVGADTVTIRDGDLARLGDVTIAGGRLVLPSGGGRIELGRELSGAGAIAGPLDNKGQLRSVGSAGLRFSGAVTGVGHAMLGDKFRFLAGGSFTGAGTIAAPVQLDSLSTLTATGDLTLGTTLAGIATILQGAVHTSAYRVECVSPSDVVIGDQVVFENGRIAYSGGATRFVLAADGILTGRGTVEGNLTSLGTLSPGAALGRVRFVGDLVTSGTYVCEAAGVAGTTHDTLLVTGVATLGGTLAIVPVAGFTAATGDSFKVVQCGTRLGTFANVTWNGHPAAGLLEVHYASDGAWVVVKQGVLDANAPADPPATSSALRFSAVGSPGPVAALELALPATAFADVRLFDVSGRELAVLHSGPLAAGVHRLELRGRSLPPGMSFARAVIGAGGGAVTRTARIVNLR